MSRAFLKKAVTPWGWRGSIVEPWGKSKIVRSGCLPPTRPGMAMPWWTSSSSLPAPWCTDAYTRRRTRCQVPDDRGFQTKPRLAAAMLRELRDEGVLPFKYVVADCLYGNSPEFLEVVEEESRTIYFVSIPA